MSHAADGSLNVTVVLGVSYTGLFAADGSINIVQVSGGSYTGIYHACGAYNAFTATTNVGYYAPCGALNVSLVASNKPGTVKITVVGGTFV